MSTQLPRNVFTVNWYILWLYSINTILSYIPNTPLFVYSLFSWLLGVFWETACSSEDRPQKQKTLPGMSSTLNISFKFNFKKDGYMFLQELKKEAKYRMVTSDFYAIPDSLTCCASKNKYFKNYPVTNRAQCLWIKKVYK